MELFNFISMKFLFCLFIHYWRTFIAIDSLVKHLTYVYVSEYVSAHTLHLDSLTTYRYTCYETFVYSLFENWIVKIEIARYLSWLKTFLEMIRERIGRKLTLLTIS